MPSQKSPGSSPGGLIDSIVLVVFLGAAVVGVGPRVWRAARGWLSTGSPTPTVRFNWSTQASWLVAGFVAGLLGLVVLRAWLKRRRRARERQLAALGEGIGARMDRTWTVGEHLRVRRWRGCRPVLVRVAVTISPRAVTREWKLTFSSTLRGLLGRIEPIRWPAAPADLVDWRKPAWLHIRVLVPPPLWRRMLGALWRRLRPGASVDPADDSAGDLAEQIEETAQAALAGLVPGSSTQLVGERLVVEYGETTRDQSPAWRTRVVDQVSARLGKTYRASWDRQARRLVLEPVPLLPHPIAWATHTARLRELELDDWVAVYGTDEHGQLVAWQPGDREPHAMISGDPGTGKALDVATPIPTPTGWTTMGALTLGDLVLDETGRPTCVTGVYDQPPNRPCFEVVFSDGAVLVADEEHRWWTEDADHPARRPDLHTHSQSPRHAPAQVQRFQLHKAEMAHVVAADRAASGDGDGAMPRVAAQRTSLSAMGSRSIPDHRVNGRVVTTGEIGRSLRTFEGRLNHAIPVAQPLRLPPVDLPIGPYALGCWLGDRASSSGRRTPDLEVVARIAADGYDISRHTSDGDRTELRGVYSSAGLGANLRQLGLLGATGDPEPRLRVPGRYLRASLEQRRALLAGLLDTNGTVTQAGVVEFVSTVESLAEDVRELALTLGYQAVIRESVCRDGRGGGSVWTVSFVTADQVFGLDRMIDVHAARTSRQSADRARRRYVTDVRPVPSRRVRCIEVDSPSHLYLAGRTMIPTHNTEAMKAVIDSLLLQGALVAIVDPKQKDFAEYLGRPGVVCVATDVDDQVGALVDIEAEMMRRTSAAALAQITKRFPELRGTPGAAHRPAPAQAAIDAVPLILVLDELTFHVAQVQEWWQRLSPAEKAGWGAEKARQAPMLTIPSRIVALARAIKIHMLIGVQRADASNFGGSTTMRDNIKHMASMGCQSPIGSEMQWGDRRTGSEVEITNPGEGMSNGLRLSPQTGASTTRGVPGRFKAWYTGSVAESGEFWDQVAAVAPDASLIHLPHVSDAARDPAAAAAVLRAKAYAEFADVPPSTDTATAGPQRLPSTGTQVAVDDPDHTASPDSATDSSPQLDPLLAEAAELVVHVNLGSAAMLQRKLRIGYERARQLMASLEDVGVVGPVRGRTARKVLVQSSEELEELLRPVGPAPQAPPRLRLVSDNTDPSPPPHAAPDAAGGPSDVSGTRVEVDDLGAAWEPVPVLSVQQGDTVQFGDIASAVVVEEPRIVEDEFDHAEVVRLVIDVDGGEEDVDLTEDDVVYRRIAQ